MGTHDEPFILRQTTVKEFKPFNEEMRRLASEQYNSHQDKIEAMAKCIVESGIDPLDVEIYTEQTRDGLKSWFHFRS